MNKKPLQIRTLVILAVVIVLGIFVAMKMKNKDGASVSADAKEVLAQCLTDKGVKFYGASWCPHCAQQKKAFGTTAMKKVTYIECAVPGDPRSQTQVCKDAKIASYPTWRFADGSEMTGEQALRDLADKAGCEYSPNGSVPAAGESSGAAGGTFLENSPEAMNVNAEDAAAQ